MWSIFFYDRYDTEDDMPKLNLYPLIVASVLAISRFMHIAVRHGLLPANQILKFKDKKVTDLKELYEGLLVRAWMRV